MENKQLTFKQAEELGGALARLAELGDSKIITKENEAERNTLQRFVTTTAVECLPDLLGAWFTVRRQYEPLLLAISGVVHQVGGIIARQQAALQEQAKQNEKPA